jgi:hypothetical protein
LPRRRVRRLPALRLRELRRGLPLRPGNHEPRGAEDHRHGHAERQRREEHATDPAADRRGQARVAAAEERAEPEEREDKQQRRDHDRRADRHSEEDDCGHADRGLQLDLRMRVEKPGPSEVQREDQDLAREKSDEKTTPAPPLLQEREVGAALRCRRNRGGRGHLSVKGKPELVGDGRRALRVGQLDLGRRLGGRRRDRGLRRFGLFHLLHFRR